MHRIVPKVRHRCLTIVGAAALTTINAAALLAPAWCADALDFPLGVVRLVAALLPLLTVAAWLDAIRAYTPRRIVVRECLTVAAGLLAVAGAAVAIAVGMLFPAHYAVRFGLDESTLRMILAAYLLGCLIALVDETIYAVFLETRRRRHAAARTGGAAIAQTEKAAP